MIKKVSLYTVLIIVSFTMLFPFVWMVSTSLKIDKEIFAASFSLLPQEKWDFANYQEVIQATNLGRSFFVSTVISVTCVVSNLLLCSMAAYAFSRLKFPGKDLLFALVLSTLMIPFQAIVVPLFVIMVKFPLAGGNNLLGQGGTGFINTFPALILPFVASAFGIFLIRQFMFSIPEELSDSARIDGCSEFYIYWSIILPLCKSVLFVLAILTFLSSWNRFMWPLVATNSQSMQVLQVAIAGLRQEFETDWALFMAASTMATVPVLILFILGQRYFVRGIALTGIKG